MYGILPQSTVADNDALDPFDLPVNPAAWPPTDPKELAAVEAWLDELDDVLTREAKVTADYEREHAERYGNGGEE